MKKTVLQPEETKQRRPAGGTSRRTVLNRLWSLLALLAFIEVGWLAGSILTSRKKQNEAKQKDTFVVAGKAESFANNSVTAIPKGQFYLARQADGSFIALSRSCTHLGCSVPWDEQSGQFICPCHGSSFDISGAVLTPPASRGLDRYPVKIENGVLLVNITRPEKRVHSTPSNSVTG